MRGKSILLALSMFAVAPVLTACEDFDADKLDVFHLNEKKKLPGERKELFPGGVPGVTQGIPPDLVKGYQPPAPTAEVAPPEPEKPKPRVVRRAPKPTPITVNPATKQQQPQQAQQQQQPQQQQPQQQQPQQQPQQAQQQQHQQQPAWPDPKPPSAGTPAAAQGTQSPWPAAQPQQQTSPWPAPPPPNTFQR